MELGGLVIRVEEIGEIPLDSRIRSFQCETGKADIRYKIVRRFPECSDLTRIYISEYYEIYKQKDQYYRVRKGQDRLPILKQSRTDWDRPVLYGDQQCLSLVGRRLIPEYLALEEPLLHYRVFLLHASLIAWRGMGIAFSAPSGIGKSTQAELWKKYLGAEILNGDRALIRNHGESIQAYGSCFAGSSGIYRRESAELKAIVILEQAEENCLRPVKGSQAFGRLYSQILSNPWNPEFVERLTLELSCLLERVPVYQLSCRPDEESVLVLKSEIERLEHGDRKSGE